MIAFVLQLHASIDIEIVHICHIVHMSLPIICNKQPFILILKRNLCSYNDY